MTQAALLGCGLLALLGSVRFKRLDTVREAAGTVAFDAQHYADSLWAGPLQASGQSAMALDTLLQLLYHDEANTFETYGNAIGIGNVRYFMVRVSGKVVAVNEDFIEVSPLTGEDKRPVFVDLEFIFGNAVRDASGLVDINSFENTMDFNEVSGAINRIIRDQVVPEVKAQAKVDGNISLIVALELNRQYLNIDTLRTVPVGVISN